MALIKCSECGKEISDKAAACIHCGCPMSAAASADNAPRSISVRFDAVVSGDDNGTSNQSVYVAELGRNVDFAIDNNTKVHEVIKVELREGSKYDYILFKAATVTKTQEASSGAAASADNPPNSISVRFDAVVSGDDNGKSSQTVYVSELGRYVEFTIDNNTKVDEVYRIELRAGSKYDYIFFRAATVTKTRKPSLGAAASYDSSAVITTSNESVKQFSDAEMKKKIKALKLRVYIKPVIRLLFTTYFLLSFVGLYATIFLYPDGGAPEMLMNVIAVGFTAGFVPVFFFAFWPYLIGRYPDPGFFLTRKIMKHLKKRNLLEKAVAEMETCELVPFGDKMCLSDSFLFPKRKNGVIIPCDELMWVYDSYSRRKGCGYLMLGTKKWGLRCFSRNRNRKQYAQASAATIQALQKRNPSILVGETRENRKTYFKTLRSK